MCAPGYCDDERFSMYGMYTPRELLEQAIALFEPNCFIIITFFFFIKRSHGTVDSLRRNRA